jgi:putative transposase
MSPSGNGKTSVAFRRILYYSYGMEHYRKSSHTTYDLKYHLVWITKYRKRVLSGEVAKRVRKLIWEICLARDVEILKGHISRDHMHTFVSVPPHLSISKLMQSIKGNTSVKMMAEFKTLSRAFWGRHIWARGYFAASSGNVTDEVIMQYIGPQGGDFRIAGDL